MIEFNRPTWSSIKHARQWAATLGTYVFPYFGDCPVDLVSSADVMNALTPIWTAKPETARRVRQRISAVMKWAIANNFRSGNPAGEAIDAALPRTPQVQGASPGTALRGGPSGDRGGSEFRGNSGDEAVPGIPGSHGGAFR